MTKYDLKDFETRVREEWEEVVFEGVSFISIVEGKLIFSSTGEDWCKHAILESFEVWKAEIDAAEEAKKKKKKQSNDKDNWALVKVKSTPIQIWSDQINVPN